MESKKIDRIVFGVALVLAGALFWYFFLKDKTIVQIPPVENPPILEEKPEPAPPAEEVLPLSYSSITLTTEYPGKEVTDTVGFEHLDAVLSLNRIDERHFKKGMTIIYPNRYDDSFALSSFPRNIPELATVPKMMFIAQEIQEFGAYEYGVLVRFGGISTGKKSTPTKNGLYHTNWKAKETISTVNDEWLLKWNFNIDNFDGVGIHQYDLPGYPASHSCIRLSEADAMWFYEWADQWKLSRDERTVLEKGTPVLLFGEYNYDVPAPWKKLAEDSNALKVTLEEIDFSLLQ